MPAFRAPLVVTPFSPTASVTINIGFRRPFIAFASVTMVDSLIDYDFDNAIAADVFTVDGAITTPLVGGGKFGGAGSFNNVFQGAFVGTGQFISIFLRRFGPDIRALAEAIVITEP
jgi:hypothetical protein